MRQLREIQPDGVHPGVRTPNVWGVGPALHKIPAHMVKLRPLQDQVRRIIHGYGIHVPDDLLAGLGIRHELLLLEEFVEFWQRMPLVPAPPFGHEELSEGVNGVVEIRRRAQERHQVVPRDLIGAELAKRASARVQR